MAPLARSPQVVCTVVEDGAVLLNMETRLYYSLNQAALELWNLVDDGGTAEGVAELLVRDFAMEPERSEATARRFLEELERERLVGPATAATAASPSSGREGRSRPIGEPELVKHDEPLHEVTASPYDPQLPLAE